MHKIKEIPGLFSNGVCCFFNFICNKLFAEDKALFSDLTNHGAKIFGGMREIIYAVSGFGIVAIAIGGFFGTLNWKWLVAIIIGLVVIALTAGIINYMVDSDVITDEMITDSLISANDNQK